MDESIGSSFMRNTRYSEMSEPPQRMGVLQPPLELPVPAGAERISLPRPETLSMPSMDLRTAIEQRHSQRRYSALPLSQEELSYLLWVTQGVKKVTDRPATLRTVPSAGARHSFETYMLVNQVDGLQPGLYRFLAVEHALALLDSTGEEINERLTHACLDQEQVRISAVTFFWCAIVERMYWRYTERGYRYLHLDAGHVCQNLYLAAEQLQCGVCAIGAFDDDLVNQALKLDGESQFAIYIASLGKKIVK